MEEDSTLYVGLDVHKDWITVAYAAGMGEVELFGKISSTDAEVDRMSKRLQSKARHIFMVYEAGRVATACIGGSLQRGWTAWCVRLH